MAPGGPLEKTIMQIQMGVSQGGGEGGATSSGSSSAGTLLPKRAIKELERFYGFDKPIWQRYLIWLGVWEREIKHRTLYFKIGDTDVKKNMGKRRYAFVRKNGAELEVYDKKGNISTLWTARFDMDISNEEIIHFEELKNNGELADVSKLEATIFPYEGIASFAHILLNICITNFKVESTMLNFSFPNSQPNEVSLPYWFVKPIKPFQLFDSPFWQESTCT
jgi:hypothetical protein